MIAHTKNSIHSWNLWCAFSSTSAASAHFFANFSVSKFGTNVHISCLEAKVWSIIPNSTFMEYSLSSWEIAYPRGIIPVIHNRYGTPYLFIKV